MKSIISDYLRRKVGKRAKFCCEYCLVHEHDMFWSYHIDHIISLKHGGKTELDNLAYACSLCNQFKGTDLGTYLDNSKRLIRLFNPRKDSWKSHFDIDNGVFMPKTLIAEATIKVLNLNQVDRIILRQGLNEENRYAFKF
jgi:HNH endonuclease